MFNISSYLFCLNVEKKSVENGITFDTWKLEVKERKKWCTATAEMISNSESKDEGLESVHFTWLYYYLYSFSVWMLP